MEAGEQRKKIGGGVGWWRISYVSHIIYVVLCVQCTHNDRHNICTQTISLTRTLIQLAHNNAQIYIYRYPVDALRYSCLQCSWYFCQINFVSALPFSCHFNQTHKHTHTILMRVHSFLFSPFIFHSLSISISLSLPIFILYRARTHTLHFLYSLFFIPLYLCPSLFLFSLVRVERGRESNFLYSGDVVVVIWHVLQFVYFWLAKNSF